MQATMTQLGTVNRRPMDVEDYLMMARRNRGWILGPLLAGITIAVVVAFFWPNTYISAAAIRIVPPTIPEKYVPTNVNVQMADRVIAMQHTILSRNTLTNIIQTYDLYRRERNRLPMEDIIERMRKDISTGSVQVRGARDQRNAMAFQIAFAYENRYMAQKVTRDLMTRFIDENSRERSSQSQQTTQFLRDQYAATKTEMDRMEAQLGQFRQANLGKLPESATSNMQQMTAIESRVLALNSSVSRAKQEQYMIESELKVARERLSAMAKAASAGEPMPGARPASTPVASEADLEAANLEKEIQKLERYLERMLEQYKPTYPDVQRIEVRIKALKKQRDDALNKKLAISAAQTPESASPQPGQVRLTPMQMKELSEAEGVIARLQNQVRAKEMEIERYIREIGEAERKSKDIQSRLELSSIGGAQLEQMMRDYDLAKKNYDELKVRLTQSQMASDVEERKQGETLEVLDLPSLPETPTKPIRGVIVAAGAVIGLVLGITLAAVRELKDTSLKSLKDVRAYTQFNVLGSIPLLENDLVVRRRRRIGILAWIGACLVSVVAMAGAIYYYYSTTIA